MRLFIAINFDDRVKKQIFDTENKLKDLSLKGNFTRYENLHLTIVFIGETKRQQDIKRVIDKIESGSFGITITDFGRFKRQGGSIYWIGIKNSSELSNIYSQLYTMLKAEGFDIEDREFKPHLTLGREVILKNEFNMEEFCKTVSCINASVNKISLMKSERIDGRLVYSEIYKKELK